MKLGSYVELCYNTPLSVCPLINNFTQCYSRSLKLGPIYLFEIPSLLVYFVALIMIAIMIHAINHKQNGIGHKEFVTFFYIYLIHIIIEIITITNLIPSVSSIYQIFVACHIGTTVSLSWCLLGNGLIIFQFIPDGEDLSIYILRCSTLITFLITLFVGLGTFNSWPGLSVNQPNLLWFLHFIIPNLCLTLYLILQFFYIYKNFKSKWLMGDLIHAFGFYWIGLLFLMEFSTSICKSTKHYLDGLSFHIMFQLMAVMMIYKYWFNLNIDDLEFEIQPLPSHMIPDPIPSFKDKSVSELNDILKRVTSHSSKPPTISTKSPKDYPRLSYRQITPPPTVHY